MSRKLVIIILALLALVMLINYLVIKPKAIDFLNGQLKEGFEGYVAYKNNQKGFYLYLANDTATVKHLQLDTLYESEAFNKPKVGGDIKHIVYTDSNLYSAAHIADKIEKLPNSNKCYLVTKDSILRFNCYWISEEDRGKIGKLDEWKADEIGYYGKKK